LAPNADAPRPHERLLAAIMRGELGHDPARQTPAPAFEIEHQRGIRCRGAQQQSRRARRRQVPAVPEDREWAQRLEMPHLQRPAEQVHVSLDETRASQRGTAELCEVVAGAMGDDERRHHLPTLFAGRAVSPRLRR
jgi:hypothetical protein